MSDDPRHRRGQAAEDAALAHLSAAGLQLETRNYRCRMGEIDLIMRDGPMTVFVEVRLRRGSSHGGGAASVDRRKQAKLTRTAMHYLQSHDPSGRRPARIDVVAISGDAGQWQIDWLQGRDTSLTARSRTAAYCERAGFGRLWRRFSLRRADYAPQIATKAATNQLALATTPVLKRAVESDLY